MVTWYLINMTEDSSKAELTDSKNRQMERISQLKGEWFLILSKVFVKNEMCLEWKCCFAKHLYIATKLFKCLYTFWKYLNCMSNSG